MQNIVFKVASADVARVGPSPQNDPDLILSPAPAGSWAVQGVVVFEANSSAIGAQAGVNSDVDPSYFSCALWCSDDGGGTPAMDTTQTGDTGGVLFAPFYGAGVQVGDATVFTFSGTLGLPSAANVALQWGPQTPDGTHLLTRKKGSWMLFAQIA
jgi:hypothetical protein